MAAWLLFFGWGLLGGQNPAAPENGLGERIATLIGDEQAVARLVSAFQSQADQLSKHLIALDQNATRENVGGILRRNVLRNLDEKIRMRTIDPVYSLSENDLERTVIGYEAFKLETFVTAGVFPKRYFGYFDERYDTAPHEGRLRQATRQAVQIINAYQTKRGSALAITDMEVAVTFIAEGGALWLREHQEKVDRLHPVQDVGLDDLASGYSDLPGLVDQLDSTLHTSLGSLVAWTKTNATELPKPTLVPNAERWLKSPNGKSGPHPYLVRYMTLEEAIVGTALMWLWEKKIAGKKLEELRAPPLTERSLEEQFIIGSLVYNSGVAHDAKVWTMIRELSSGEWIYKRSEKNARSRWRLNVLPPKRALKVFLEGGDYPEQPTAWLAVYHVLQRYGAYAALKRFTDVFDQQGMFREVLESRQP